MAQFSNRPLTRIAKVLSSCAVSLALMQSAQADQVTVFAAASLKNALDEIADVFEEGQDVSVTVSYAGSSVLARQIALGAPADVFVSASIDWMDYLQAEGLVEPSNRIDLLTNEIVLIAHEKQQQQRSQNIDAQLDLAGLLGDGKLAMALVEAVPAGQYSKAALVSLGLWDSVARQVAQTDNVRAALALVATGEAPYGIVYASDAVAEVRVSVVGAFPSASHPPIIYPAAVIASGTENQALAFFNFLQTDTAANLFVEHGFGLVE